MVLGKDWVEKSHWSDEERHREVSRHQAEQREESALRVKKGRKVAVTGGDSECSS